MAIEDPLYYPKKLMIISGLDTDRSFRGRLRSALLTCFYVSGLSIGFFCHSYITLEQLREYNNSEPAVYMCVVFHVSTKYIAWHLRHTRIRSLMGRVDEAYGELTRVGLQRSILEKAVSKCNNMSKSVIAALIYVYMNRIYVLINHFLDPVNNVELPYLSYVPIDRYKHYYWAVTFQYIVCGTPFMLVAMQYISLLSFTVLISAQMDILKDYLRNLKPYIKNDDSEALDKFNKGVILYQDILSFVREMNEIFSGVIIIEILTSTLQCCLSAYLLAKIPLNDPHFFLHASTFMVTVSLPFFHCWCGQTLDNSSSGISDAIYDSGWEQAPVKVRR